MNRLARKHAFVTGASRGIGAAIATGLEQAGATVTRVARHARENIAACDVSSAEQVALAMAQAEQRHGPIDILVNNAGVAASSPFLKTGSDQLERMLDTNFKGAWYCSQKALPRMLDAGWGRIINIASTAALDGYPYLSAYCASKHALLGMTKALAAELARSGVAVSAICPGYTDTDMLTESIANIGARTGMPADQARATLAAFNPGRRIVAPTEIAATVVALCTAESGHANGQIIPLPRSETTS